MTKHNLPQRIPRHPEEHLHERGNHEQHQGKAEDCDTNAEYEDEVSDEAHPGTTRTALIVNCPDTSTCE